MLAPSIPISSPKQERKEKYISTSGQNSSSFFSENFVVLITNWIPQVVLNASTSLQDSLVQSSLITNHFHVLCM